MNPQNGEIYAMGSNPSFNPNIFTKPVSSSVYAQLNNPSSGYPLIDRAIQSAGPTGSTFKPITATAALQSGAWNVGDTFDDTGKYCLAGQCRHNAGNAVNGVLDLERRCGSPRRVLLQPRRAAERSPCPRTVVSSRSGRDNSGSAARPGSTSAARLRAICPTPTWRNHRRTSLESECDAATGPFKGKPPSIRRAAAGSRTGPNRPWSVGDNINLAVGQGDVQVTPLQLATAYSAIANGGTVVRPHIGLDMQEPDGTILQRIDPPPARHLNFNPTHLDAIRTGLHDAAQTSGGTSDDVMGNFPQQVYGKTGTAQYTGQQDYSWYVCFVPRTATSKPILVVVWVEQGGFGAQAAAPAARQILSQWFYGSRGSFQVGSSKTL